MKQYTIRAFKVDWLNRTAGAVDGKTPTERQESETLGEMRLASCLALIIAALVLLALLLCIVHIWAYDGHGLRSVNVMTESGEIETVLIPKGW